MSWLHQEWTEKVMATNAELIAERDAGKVTSIREAIDAAIAKERT